MVSTGAAFRSCEDAEPAALDNDSMCHASVESIVRGPQGLVAYGHDGIGVAAWTSDNGAHWERKELTVPEACCDPTGFPRVEFADKMIGASTVETFDSDCCPTGVNAHVVESADGLAWSLVDTGAAFEHASVSSLATNGETVVLLGSRGLRSPQLITWASNDGVAWTESTLKSDELFGLEVHHDRVTRVHDGFLAVTGLGMWHSDDGIIWNPQVVDPALLSFSQEAMGTRCSRRWRPDPTGH